MAVNNQKLPSFTPEWAKPLILHSAEKYNIPAPILASLIQQESGYNSNAISPAGARGIAQFMPKTAEGMGIDPMNPAQAIPGAAHYLRNAMDQFGGDIGKALASYNAGTNAVRHYNGIPPYKETQNYVRNIMSMSGMSGAQPQGQPAPQQQQIQQLQQFQQPQQQSQQRQLPQRSMMSPIQNHMPQITPMMSPLPTNNPMGPVGRQGDSAQNPLPVEPWDISKYHGGLQIMMGGQPQASHVAQAQQTPPTSLASILSQGGANAPKLPGTQQSQVTPSAILQYLLGGNTA